MRLKALPLALTVPALLITIALHKQTTADV